MLGGEVFLSVPDPTDLGTGAPGVRVLGAMRAHSRGQPQGLSRGDDGEGVSDLCWACTNQEVPKGVFFESAS
jgi:hypothetical protein